MSLSFLWPAAAPLLLLPPIVFVLWLLRDRARARSVIDAIGPRAPALAGEASPSRRKRARVIGAVALFLAVLAVLQPLFGEGDTKIAPRGIDMVVCLDVSRSMLARDVSPSRLLAARREIRALAQHARADRMALVVFAGAARLTAPLTQDLDSFAEIADLADPLSIDRGGTDLGAALDAALEALEGARGDHAAILLMTDGEDLEQRGLQAAEHCKNRNVVVHAVGFGSSAGSKIPIETERGGEIFLRDRSGKEVVSALDPAGLKAIAAATGGDYVDGGGSGSALLELYDRRILPMAQKAFDDRANRERANRYQWPLVFALLFWVLELAWTHRRLA